MYWRAETAASWQALWQSIHALVPGGPAALVPPPDDLGAHWLRPDLLLSQTCSLPYRLSLAPHVTLLGAFDFDLPGTPPGHYHSVILQRKQASNITRYAVNSFDSQSGWAALSEWAGPLPRSDIRITGAHLASAKSVAQGDADLCAVDAVTWRFIERYDPALASELVVVDRTQPTPGLPLITGMPEQAQPLQRALKAVCDNAPSALGIRGFVPLEADLYRALPLPHIPGAQRDDASGGDD